MSYDAVFGSFALDMIALESAVQLYEVENDITDDYLSNNVSYDAIDENVEAKESVIDGDDSSFAFGLNLFETTVAMESEGSGSSDSTNNTDTKKKESFGSKLKGGIKSLLANIGKLFSSIGTKIKEIGAKISEKIKSMQVKKEDKLRNAVLKEAQAVRKAFQQAVNVLDNTIKTDATEVNKICAKINEAINKAKEGGATADVKGLGEVGNAYGAGADKDIDDTRKRVENCKKAQQLLAKHIDGVSSAYDNLCAKLSKLKIQHDKNMRYTEDERVNYGNPESKSHDTRTEAVKTQNQEAVKKFNESREKGSQVSAAGKSYETVTITKEMVKSILISEEYSQKTNIAALQKECDAVADTCSKNADFCTNAAKIAESDIDKDNVAAKRAFALCKLYMEASGVFTKISAHITQLSTGSIFGSGSDATTGDRKFAKADDE